MSAADRGGRGRAASPRNLGGRRAGRDLWASASAASGAGTATCSQRAPVRSALCREGAAPEGALGSSDSRGEAGLSSALKHGSLFLGRCPSGTAERGHARPTLLRDCSAGAAPESSSKAGPAARVHQRPGCGPRALPAFTLIEEVPELKERFICSPLAVQRLQLSASAISTFFQLAWRSSNSSSFSRPSGASP